VAILVEHKRSLYNTIQDALSNTAATHSITLNPRQDLGDPFVEARIDVRAEALLGKKYITKIKATIIQEGVNISSKVNNRILAGIDEFGQADVYHIDFLEHIDRLMPWKKASHIRSSDGTYILRLQDNSYTLSDRSKIFPALLSQVDDLREVNPGLINFSLNPEQLIDLQKTHYTLLQKHAPHFQIESMSHDSAKQHRVYKTWSPKNNNARGIERVDEIITFDAQKNGFWPLKPSIKQEVIDSLDAYLTRHNFLPEIRWVVYEDRAKDF
jgi:hypothetical protein